MDPSEPLLTSLDESGVSIFFSSLGFPYYSQQIKEHGITGEILIHLDHEALKDIGIHSVGQRLAILRAVYGLKVRQNVPVEEGHWVPPSDELDNLLFSSSNSFEDDLSSSTTLPSRQILNLLYERDDRIKTLEQTLSKLQDSLSSILHPEPIPKRTTTKSPTTTIFPTTTTTTTSLLPPPLTSSHLPSKPRTPLDPDSPRSPLSTTHNLTATTTSQTEVALTPTTPTGPNSNDPLVPPAITISSNSSSGHSQRTTTADNPYRSFRVTLEDPCYKVLPAALKKYKINDDWRLYALFICYGNTERCLSYDEKPLLLFQRLKESSANPVFMLRHIKDIKSPIAVASAKHALRRDKRDAKAGLGLDSVPRVDRNGQLLVGVKEEKVVRNTRLHFPPVLLPVGKDRDGGDGGGGGEEEKGTGGSGWCISIYPYLAEREDEFDVNVGDTFVIISKTKGWWVVHRDVSLLAPETARKSAWVPAGCLLETSVAPLSLIPGGGSTTGGNAANVPIEPVYVVSVSTPGVALMDYTKSGSDELDVKKGMGLRILKRYNHWSYAIKEDGQRGWIPSWFCGRASASRDPTTPTFPTSGRNGSATTATVPPIVTTSTIRQVTAAGEDDGDLL